MAGAPERSGRSPLLSGAPAILDDAWGTHVCMSICAFVRLFVRSYMCACKSEQPRNVDARMQGGGSAGGLGFVGSCNSSLALKFVECVCIVLRKGPFGVSVGGTCWTASGRLAGCNWTNVHLSSECDCSVHSTGVSASFSCSDMFAYPSASPLSIATSMPSRHD